MKNIKLKKLLAEKVNENDFDYSILGPMAKVQQAFDTKYKWVIHGAADHVPSDTFDTVDDFKRYNTGIVEYFTKMLKQLNAINSKLK